jgi:hypothetical protein
MYSPVSTLSKNELSLANGGCGWTNLHQKKFKHHNPPSIITKPLPHRPPPPHPRAVLPREIAILQKLHGYRVPGAGLSREYVENVGVARAKHRVKGPPRGFWMEFTIKRNKARAAQEKERLDGTGARGLD